MNKYIFLLSMLVAPYFTIAQCTIENATSCECEDSSQNDCDLLPDITVCWQHGSEDYTEYPPGGGLQDGEINYPENWFEITPEVQAMGRIRVGARTPNIGAGPLNLRGADQYGYRWMICYDSGQADTFQVYDPEWNEESYCPDGSSPKHISWQRVFHKNADGTMSFYEVMVGTMEYHPTHGHMHFDQWTIMTLRIPDEDNMENPLEWEIVGEGAKVGFCVMDLGNCSSENAGCRDDESVYGEGTLLSQDDFPNYGLGGGSYGCSPISQGISSGYNDTYGSYLDGMFLNIPLGTCNGDYAVVLEVPQVMVESRLDNNYTWFPVTLTQQSAISDMSILSSASVLCEGEIAELSTSYGGSNASYLWSTGETTPSIEVSQAGSYSLEIGLCGQLESIDIELEASGLTIPVVEDTTICEGESVTLVAESNANILWYDVDGLEVGQGENFTTPILYENTTYFASAFENTNGGGVGPTTHEGDSEYSGGQNSVGRLVFDAFQDFTLNSVDVYTNEPGVRKIVLMNSDGVVLLEHTEDVPESSDSPHTINLNFEISAGTGYMLTTDNETSTENFGGDNPQLKRTGTNSGVSFPYTLDGVASITSSYWGGDLNSNYYYYFYNWSVSSRQQCHMVPVEIKIDCDQTSIVEKITDLGFYPNPSSGLVKLLLSLNQNSDIKISVSNSLGQVVLTKSFSNTSTLNETLDMSLLGRGVYGVRVETENTFKTDRIVIQ